ncbi:TniQ family protein [Streptomyces similanensis]
MARRMDTTLGDVLLHFGFPVRQRAGNQFRGIPADWTIFLDGRLTAAVAHATGTAREAVTSLTLAHYDGRALQMSAGGRAVSRHVLWGRGRGSRFCPECLHSAVDAGSCPGGSASPSPAPGTAACWRIAARTAGRFRGSDPVQAGPSPNRNSAAIRRSALAARSRLAAAPI